ncbi:hypothetical protein ACW4FQ_29070, partial [Escherichia coli]
MGIFPAPLAMRDEIECLYGVERIATLPEVTLSYYLVSAGRHLSHPGVQAVMEGARQRLVELEKQK